MKAIHEAAYRELVTELRLARKRVRLTQADVAGLLGRSRQWVHKVETFEIRMDVCQLIRFCHLYGLKAHELVRGLEETL